MQRYELFPTSSNNRLIIFLFNHRFNISSYVMPHFCGGNRQAPSRRKTCIQGGTVSSEPAATTRGAEWSIRRRMCLDDKWRCCLRHVADVYVPATAGAFSSARTTTSQPIRLSRHLMRNGAEQWYWQQERIAWCASCMGNALQLWR